MKIVNNNLPKIYKLQKLQFIKKPINLQNIFKYLFSCLICFYIISSTNLYAAQSLIEDFKKFQEIFNRVYRQHISKPETQQLLDGAINGLLKTLDDPYTVYMQEKETERFQEHIKAHFGGIGIAIGNYLDTTTNDSYLQIIEILPVKNCPALAAGLKAKDLILKIGEIDAKNMEFEIARNYLRGEVGSEVILKIRRYIETDTFAELDIKVIRGEIELQQVYIKTLNDSIGYLRLRQFTELSGKEVKENLEILMDSGARAIIFDLRSNSGGLLNVAVDIVSLFFKEKKRVVYTKDRNENITSDYYTNGQGICDLPVVLLVNEISASAAEIVTGALKAHKRAEIVGKKTFGKGSVQQVFQFKDNTSLKLTIAYYYTPDNICINKIGIKPDVEIDLDQKTQKDEQLEKAIEILKNKI